MTNTENNTFLPAGYELPVQSGGFTKFEDGETKIRILTNTILSWRYFIEVDGKIETKVQKDRFKQTPGIKKGDKQQEVWSFVVYNYTTKAIEICQLAQATVKNTIYNLYMEDSYGDPKGYDLKIIKEGSGMKTKYNVMPMVPKEVDEKIKEEFLEADIDLEKVVFGEDEGKIDDGFPDFPE